MLKHELQQDCPFCRKLSALDSLPPGEVVHVFPHSVAFLGPWQFYPGYCVLVAKQHARELSGLGVPHTYREYRGRHGWKFWSAHIHESLVACLTGMR